MIEHSGLPVEGYKRQSQSAVDAVNVNKKLEESILKLIDKLQNSRDCDPRWLALGKTHIETGFMFLNRAIFKPQRLD